MDEQNTIQTATTITDLKTAFDQAVEERKIIDAKIAEIKKQIQAQRKQYEDLDKKTDIYTETPSDLPIPNLPIPDISISDTIKNLFRLVAKYLIPIIIILAFIGIYLHRNAAHTSYVVPVDAVVAASIEATQTIFQFFV